MSLEATIEYIRLKDKIREEIDKKDTNFQEIKRLIQTHESSMGKILDAKGLDLKACKIMKVSREDIYGKNRRRDICYARYLIWKSLKNRGWSLNQIGLRYNRNHATVLSGIRAYDSLVESNNKYFRSKYLQMENILL